MTEEELLEIIKNQIEDKKKNKKFPYHVNLIDLYHEYGKLNIREALRGLKRKKKIRQGDTMNGKYYVIEK